jgi:phosphoglucomutase
MAVSPNAGQVADAADLVNVGRLMGAYYDEKPDPSNPAERVSFGTSGHRGTSFERTFTESHVLAISEAVCRYRESQGISHAVLGHNRGDGAGTADGIVVTPSHNPPGDGGYKYNPPHGGPADTDVTDWIEREANQLLEDGVSSIARAASPDPRGATTSPPTSRTCPP